MILPIGGLSLIAHLMILLARVVHKTFSPTFYRLKGEFLRWGLKFSRNVCLVFFAKDTFLRKALAFSIIICVFFTILSTAVFAFIKLSFGENSNFVLVDDFIRARGVAAENNISLEPKTVQLGEVPLAKEILEQSKLSSLDLYVLNATGNQSVSPALLISN